MSVKIVKLKNTKDIIKWVSWLNDSNVTHFSQQRFSKHTIKSQKIFIRKKIKDKSSVCFKIFYNKKFVGVVEIGNINFIHRTCEVMYFVGEKNLWKKGIASKSVKLATKYAFKNLKMYKIYAGTYSLNISSQKVLLKNKFKKEAILKNYFILSKKGLKRDDKVIFSLSKR